MAETQQPTVGYMGEMWLYNGTVLYELRKVKEFDSAGAGTRERVEVTDLKSPNWRRQKVSTFYEDSEFEVLLYTRMLSDTDSLLEDALAEGDERAFKQVFAEDGVPYAQAEGICKCIGYDRGRVVADEVMEATATFEIVSVGAVEAYAA
jgi:hypothetical protein